MSNTITLKEQEAQIGHEAHGEHHQHHETITYV